jgi:hypothetical protein
MSYQDGWAALHLEMPDRVPHTEYSIEMHLELIKRLLNIPLTPQDSDVKKNQAGVALAKELNFDFIWSILTHNQIFGEHRTSMGHASYMEAGTDFDSKTFQLFEDPEDAFAFDPFALYGIRDKRLLTAEYDKHFDQLKQTYENAVTMTGIYVTCMSGLIEIFGWDMLLTACGLNPNAFGEVTNRYCNWILQYFEALAKCKAPVVMIHDDIVWSSGAFLHPDWYRRYIFPNYKKLFQPLHDAGKIIMYTSDGMYTQFIDNIAECGVHSFVMEPTTDMAYIAEKYGKTHSFVGNADTRILLSGTKEDIQNEVRRCMDIGKKYPGFFMAVGNHIPPNTPVENVLIYLDEYEKQSKR